LPFLCLSPAEAERRQADYMVSILRRKKRQREAVSAFCNGLRSGPGFPGVDFLISIVTLLHGRPLLVLSLFAPGKSLTS
jgi:hypothetical protein